MEQKLYDMQEKLSTVDYMKAISAQTEVEKTTLDFDKPFSLYCGQMQIGFSERINLMERETIQLFRKQIGQLNDVLTDIQKKYGHKMSKDDLKMIKKLQDDQPIKPQTNADKDEQNAL